MSKEITKQDEIMKYNKMNAIANMFYTLLIVIMILLAYTIIHDGSHALFVMIFGGNITTFDVNVLYGFPHISWTGNLSSLELAIVNIAGPLVPYILLMLGFVLIHKERALLIQKSIRCMQLQHCQVFFLTS